MEVKDAPSVKFAACNAQSIKSKTASVCDFIISLDLLIARDTDNIISNITVQSDQPSDHAATVYNLNIARPDPVKLQFANCVKLILSSSSVKLILHLL